MTRSESPPVTDFGGHLVVDGPTSMPEIDSYVGPIHTDPERVIDRYSAAGIENIVLSQPPHMGDSDVERVREANDKLLEYIESHDQLFGLAALPVGAGGEAAAAELERCLENGYHGGALETKSEGIRLTESEVDPVFEVANDTSAPLLVHPKLDDSLHPQILDDTYALNAISGREAALSATICTLIHHGTYDEYPELNLVFHHLGGNIASMMGRIELHLDRDRWPGRNATKPFGEFKEQLENRVFIDSSGFFGYHAPLRAALEEFPVTQILFGTDAPYEPRSAAELGRLVDTVRDHVPNSDSRRILHTNSLDLLVNV